MRAFSPVVILAALAGCHHAGYVPAPPPANGPAVYDSLTTRLADGYRDVDFTLLRLSYATTSQYEPYGATVPSLRDSVFAALERKNVKAAMAFADSMLAVGPINPWSHLASLAARDAGGDPIGAEYHQFMLHGIVESVARSGAGTAEEPFVVITVDEEYAYLWTRDLQRRVQAEVPCGEARCDYLEVHPSGSKEVSGLYFDITIPFSWLSRRLSKED